MQTLFHDLRFFVRMLRKQPSFAAIVIFALAIGIGANTAIFSVVNAVLLRRLPFSDPDRIVMVWMDNKRMNVDQDIHSYPNYVDYRDQNQSFEELAAYSGVSLNLIDIGEPERIIGTVSTASMFSVLGVQPLLGRVYTVEEEEPGRDQVVVLGYGLWQRRFGGDRSIIGQTISLSDVKREVIGVMPVDFRFPHKDAELWAPLAIDANRRAERGGFSYYAVGKLKAGVPLEQARVDMSGIASQLEQQYPAILEGYGVNLVPLHEQVVGKTRPALLVLLGAVVFVLFIGCANVANLLLARAAVREREIAIRTALGAGRMRLIRQLLTESALLGLLGGAVGLVIANWGLKALIALSPADLPRLDQINIDGRVLLFTLGVSLLTGLIFGLVPALQTSKPDLNESLKEGGGRSAAGVRGRRIRSALVVFEIALSLMLLIGAGLMIRSFKRLQEVNLGFAPDRLLTMNLQLSRSRYQGRQGAAFYDRVIQRLGYLPSVESAGAITAMFIDALPNSTGFTIEGKPPLPVAEQIETPVDFVTPGYFHTMRISLQGRDFTEKDVLDAPRVVIINKTFAERFWPGEDPLGKRFKFGPPDSTSAWMSIVGVVADMRRTGYEADVRCESFLPHTQRPFIGFMTLVVRAKKDPRDIISAVREEIWAIDSNQPISHIITMDQQLDQMVAQRKLNMVLFGIFAAVALLLAAVGVYGVMSYSVTQREHEMGIRMALGARGSHVIKLVLGQGMALALAGVAIGEFGAFVLTRVMSTLLYDVSTTDTVTFAVIPALLMGVALVACFIPARRATKVDPMSALRCE